MFFATEVSNHSVSERLLKHDDRLRAKGYPRPRKPISRISTQKYQNKKDTTPRKKIVVLTDRFGRPGEKDIKTTIHRTNMTLLEWMFERTPMQLDSNVAGLINWKEHLIECSVASDTKGMSQERNYSGGGEKGDTIILHPKSDRNVSPRFISLSKGKLGF